MSWDYFLTVHLVFSLLVLCYWWLLEKSQQFQWNRVVLWSTVLLAFLLPALPKLVSMDQPLVHFPAGIELDTAPPAQIIEEPAIAEAAPVDPLPSPTGSLSWIRFFWMAYFVGFGLFFLRYAIRLFRLLQFIAWSPKKRYEGKYWLLSSDRPLAPFSFFHFLVLGKNTPAATQQQILQHEKVHADQWHSLDVMLTEWMKILFWFNPVVYLYARLVRNNLEFLVDQRILASGVNKRLYQYHLLQVSTGGLSFNFINPYNHSFLKKRIVMMNNRKTTKWSQVKLILFALLTLPLLQAFGQAPTEKAAEDTYVIITSDATKSELEQLQDELFKNNTQLIFEELTFGDDAKLRVMRIKVIARDRGQLGYHFDKSFIEEKGFVPLFAIKVELPQSGMISVGTLEAEDIDQLMTNWKRWQIRTAGVDPSIQGLKDFRKRIMAATEENLKRKANMSEKQLEETTKGEGRTTYDHLDEESLQKARKKIQALARKHNLSPVYFVDGLQKKVTLDEFQLDQLDKVEVVTKYKSSRTGKEFNPQCTDLQVFLPRKLKVE